MEVQKPDAYEIMVYYTMNAEVNKFEAVSHAIRNGYLEIITKTDFLRIVIPMTSIKKIEFDKRFTQCLSAIQLEEELKKEKQKLKGEENGSSN